MAGNLRASLRLRGSFSDRARLEPWKESAGGPTDPVVQLFSVSSCSQYLLILSLLVAQKTMHDITEQPPIALLRVSKVIRVQQIPVRTGLLEYPCHWPWRQRDLEIGTHRLFLQLGLSCEVWGLISGVIDNISDWTKRNLPLSPAAPCPGSCPDLAAYRHCLRIDTPSCRMLWLGELTSSSQRHSQKSSGAKFLKCMFLLGE